MRKLHRYVSIVAAAYLLNMAITGVLLGWGGIGDSVREVRRPGMVSVLPEAQLESLLEATYQVARKNAPDAPIVAIRIGMGNGEPRGAVTFSGEHSGVLLLDPIKGSYLVGQSGEVGPGGAEIDSHTFLKRLHRGDFIGYAGGRWMSIIAGLCLLFLAISGIAMYFEMRARRKQLGRGGWFWS
ncbi:MAG: PepSY-associated TM helix domain-containing protein [Steroidobacteraceae bacterium]